VVPLLIFAWTLHTLGAIRSTQAQLSLGLALGVALLGFWMFRSLLSRMAEVVQALAAAVEQTSRTARRAPASAPASAEAPAAAASASAPVPASEPAASVAPANGGHEVPAAAPTPASVLAKANGVTAPATIFGSPPQRPTVAGIGKIRELTEVAQTMDALWQREAKAHLNHRVQISVANSREPLIGTLSEATGDGLILEQPDGPVPIAYGRVTSIDRLS
jgi:hypothetical protein